MKTGKTIRIIVAAIAVLLLITALVLMAVKQNKNVDPANSIQNDALNYDISGVWYSDQEKSDSLTLNKDGSYTSSSWLAPGNYVIQGESVNLTDSYGTTKTLEIKQKDSTYTLYFNNGNNSHTYYRAEKDASAGQETKKEEAANMQELYTAAFSQILTTGSWTDSSANTTLAFSATEYTASNHSSITGADETVKFKYNTTSLSVENDVYKASWTMTDKDGTSYSVNDITVTVKDNHYTLYSSSMPYARTFTKTVDIVFEQPDGSNTTPTGNSGTKEIITSDSQSGKDYASKVSSKVDSAIIGTWKGTFEERPTPQTIYWTYSFKQDGSYTFINGQVNQGGAYTLTHNPGNKYHSTLHLKPDNDKEMTINFYLSGSSPIMLTLEGDTDPTYIKGW